MRRKKAIRLIGNALMIVAVAFIAYKLYQYREAFIKAFTWKIGGIMLVSSMFTACTFLVMGMLYAGLIERISGGSAPKGLSTAIYCKSNLYKYIPGNVLQYVGRNQIAEFTNARHDQVILASLTEVAIQVIGALLVALILARGYVLDWFRKQNQALLLCIVVLGIAVLILAFLILKKKKSEWVGELKRFLSPRNGLFLMGMLAFIMISQIVNGVLFVWLMRELAPELPREFYSNIAGVYCFAWLVGFVTPGAPGGMGIREALLSVLLANVVRPETITASVVLNRIVTICGDVIAYFASKLFMRFDRSQRTT